MAQLHRTNDAVLTLCQNNATQSIEICEITPAVAPLLGYEEGDLVGHGLARLLPEKLATQLTDYVEFEEEGNDVAAVIEKIKDFSLRKRNGNVIPLHAKIVRVPGEDRNAWFKLILRGEEQPSLKETLIARLVENFSGHQVLDETYNLPDRHSLVKDIELLSYHLHERHLSGCFAAIEIDHYSKWLEEHSRTYVNDLLKQVAALCRRTLRGYDTVGVLSPSCVGVLLVDTSRDTAQIALNRLRWAIGSQPVEKSNLTVSIAFSEIKERVPPSDIIRACEKTLQQSITEKANRIVEACHE